MKKLLPTFTLQCRETVVEYRYARNSYTVTVNKGTGIASVAGDGSYQYGAQVTVSATAAEGYGNVTWSGDYKTASFTMPAKNVTVTASAAKQQQTASTYTVTIVVNDETYGTVDRTSVTNVASGTRISTSSNKLTIGQSGSRTRTSSTTTVTATPAANTAEYEYKFSSWQNVPSTVTGDVTITANFSKSERSYTLTVKSASSTMGTVAGGGTYKYGDTATITATAKNGYEFTKWNDGNTESTRTVTVTGAATYTASFARTASQQHTHSYSNWKSNNNGTHTGTCSCGETKTENCTYRNNVCTVCGYRKTSSQSQSSRQSGSGLFNIIRGIFGR